MILLVSLACEKHGEWRDILAVLYHLVTSSNLISSYSNCWLSWLNHWTSYQDDPSSCTVAACAANQSNLKSRWFLWGGLPNMIWCSSLWISTFTSGVGCSYARCTSTTTMHEPYGCVRYYHCCSTSAAWSRKQINLAYPCIRFTPFKMFSTEDIWLLKLELW